MSSIRLNSVQLLFANLWHSGWQCNSYRGCASPCQHFCHKEAAIELLEELLGSVEDLCSHAFGSYVIRHVLEFGLPEHKHRVATAMLPRVAWYAKHRLASHVVEAALKHCSPEDQSMLASGLLVPEQIAALATNQFGRHVVRALLATQGPLKQQTEATLRGVEGKLKYSRFGKALLQLVPAA